MSSRWEVIGHDSVIEGLAKAVADRSPHHAYLFTGPEHVGKLTVARIFAQSLLCGQAAPPCGKCPNCLLYLSGNHPDYLELPRENGLTIAQVRELKSKLSLKPHSATFRLGIIPNAGRLSLPAQNALLKLLEEPPPVTVLILTASSAGTLLPTTTSRCQLIHFGVPAADELRSALREDAVSRQAIRMSGHRPGLALRLLEDESALAERVSWEQRLLEVVTSPAGERLKIAKEIADGDSVEQLIDAWLGYHHEALQGEYGLKTDALSDGARQLARHYAPAQLRANAERLFAARDRLRYNPNVLLLMENLLLGLGE